jgi:hypothetical protein
VVPIGTVLEGGVVSVPERPKLDVRVGGVEVDQPDLALVVVE